MKTINTSFNPVVKSDTVKQLVIALKDYIINNDLKPGTEIPSERELSSQLGVSRYSLREALRVAQAQGLIDISQGKRPRVSKPSSAAAAEVIALSLRRSKNTLMDLIVARQCLECQIARLAAVNAQQSHIDKMQETIRQIEINKEDINYCADRDIEFHNILLRASGNVVFEIMLSPLADLLRESRIETMRQNRDRAIEGHKSILSAVKSNNEEEAFQSMYRHLEKAKEDLIGGEKISH